MNKKKIIPALAVDVFKSRPDQQMLLDSARLYDESGADELILWDVTKDLAGREEALIDFIKELTRLLDIPLWVCQIYHRFEDVKKIIYAGAHGVILDLDILVNINVIGDATERFGVDKVLLHSKDAVKLLAYSGNGLLVHEEQIKDMSANAAAIYPIGHPDTVLECLKADLAAGFVSFELPVDVMDFKRALTQQQIPVNVFESSMDFESFKLGSDGLIPVITQDYKSSKVLMLAYMNKEAFDETIRSGRMTYYSRSRQCLWKKGETSGHYQFVKSLEIDCDYDTILAKVSQIGAACHTGSESCFFTNLVHKEYDDTNPLTIFEEIMATILDRKNNPKEGSYTNYLFDHGVDKILKKVGEEATEIVIAAKNPGAEELRYEISDFLYHMMVLMADRNVSWQEITRELAKRH